MTDRTLTQDLSYSYDAAGVLQPAAPGTPLVTSESFSDVFADSNAEPGALTEGIEDGPKLTDGIRKGVAVIGVSLILLVVGTIIYTAVTYSSVS